MEKELDEEKSPHRKICKSKKTMLHIILGQFQNKIGSAQMKFCWNVSPTFTKRVSQSLNECLAIRKMFTWLVEGRRMLVIKDTSNDSVGNHCPIASSNLLWKILTNVILESASKELNNFWQKECWKNSQGTKDHLASAKQ